ncbi:hypothetical protein I9W82_000416 [Candida metapsilosis]|uniref:Uncharacterized protein n=1 Tax=Candida metapsilosis TaxID=273372 RepID=A0A8H8DEG6_9ASCO|nr:hypothetical protein I9W82_000416 [Candida metapsilosis]
MPHRDFNFLSGEEFQKLISLIPPQKFKEVFPDLNLNSGIIVTSPFFVLQPTSNPIDNTTTQFDQGQDSIKMTTPPLATNPHLQSPNHFESDPVGFSSIDAIYDDDTYDSYPDGYYSVGILDAGGFHNSLLCPEVKDQVKEGRFNTIGEFQMMMMNLDNQEAETDEEEDKNWIYNMSSNVEEGRVKYPQSVSDHSSHVLQIEPDLEETSGRKNDARDTLSALQKNNLPSQQEHQQQQLNENNAVDEEETEDEDVSIDSEADQFHVPYYEIDEAADSTVSLGQKNDGDGATEVEENAASSSTENPTNNPPTTTKKKKNNIFTQLKYRFYLKLYQIRKRFRKPQYYDSDYDTEAREFYAYMRGQTPRIMYEYYTDDSESLDGR